MANIMAQYPSKNPSPSFARRKALREADEANQTRLVHSYPLGKYFVIAKRLLDYFQQSFEQLKLDEAYVYGMRFAQLGLTTLPKHRDWTIVDEVAKENLRIQVTEVLSRLETIKRRMDEEEVAKTRAKMLAMAEEETRRQNRFHQEQELRRQDFARNVSDPRDDRRLQAKTKGRKATNKLKKFFSIPKSNKKSSKTKPFHQGDTSEAPQPALCSLATIRESRAQHEPHAKNHREASPSVVTHYAIEELSVAETLPLVEEVTLRLHSTQTPSPMRLELNCSMDETFGKEFDDTEMHQPINIFQQDHRESKISSMVPPVVGGQKISPLKIPSIVDSSEISSHRPIISASEMSADKMNSLKSLDNRLNHKLRRENESSSADSEKSNIEKVLSLPMPSPADAVDTKKRILKNRVHRLVLAQSCEKDRIDHNELVLDELRKKLASMYTGDHVIVESIVQESSGPTEKQIHSSQNTIFDPKDDHSFVKENTRNDSSQDARNKSDTLVAKTELIEGDSNFSIRESNRKSSGADTFAQFDAFLVMKALGDEESEDRSFMGFSILEEGSGGVEKGLGEVKSHLDFTIEETLADEDIYLEYTVTEESVQTHENKAKVEGEKESKTLVNSPTCVASCKILSTNKEQSFPLARQVPTFQPTNESLQTFPDVNLTPSSDNDDMTHITMDTFLKEIDAGEKDPMGENYKQAIKKILHVELWNRDVAIVKGAMMMLNEIVKNRTSSRTKIAEYRGIMAIVRTMITFQDDEGIQFLCCDTLRLLASEPVNKSMINNMDVVSLISRSVVEHPTSQRLQDAARGTVAAVYL